MRTIQVKGYAGVDVDFEYLPAQEGEAYAAFVALRSTLQPYGYTVTVALSPKTYADQPGLLYEGHNYALLGAAADFVFLMTYEWGVYLRSADGGGAAAECTDGGRIRPFGDPGGKMHLGCRTMAIIGRCRICREPAGHSLCPMRRQ